MFQCSLHSLHDEMFITKDRRVLHSVLLPLLLTHGGQVGGTVSTVVLELSLSLREGPLSSPLLLIMDWSIH